VRSSGIGRGAGKRAFRLRRTAILCSSACAAVRRERKERDSHSAALFSSVYTLEIGRALQLCPGCYVLRWP
jgi:hypothetical protein